MQQVSTVTLKTMYRCSENVAEFRYFRMTVTNQMCFHKKMKDMLYSGNTCSYYF